MAAASPLCPCHGSPAYVLSARSISRAAASRCSLPQKCASRADCAIFDVSSRLSTGTAARPGPRTTGASSPRAKTSRSGRTGWVSFTLTSRRCTLLAQFPPFFARGVHLLLMLAPPPPARLVCEFSGRVTERGSTPESVRRTWGTASVRGPLSRTKRIGAAAAAAGRRRWREARRPCDRRRSGGACSCRRGRRVGLTSPRGASWCVCADADP